MTACHGPFRPGQLPVDGFPQAADRRRSSDKGADAARVMVGADERKFNRGGKLTLSPALQGAHENVKLV